MNFQLRGAVVVIVFGYVLGFYFQNRRIDDLRSEMNARLDAMEHRFDDLKDWIRAELRRIDERIDNLAARVERLERRLEERIVRP